MAAQPPTDGFSPPAPYAVGMHTVVVLALDGVISFDLATPVETFGRARLPDGRPAYRIRVCGPTKEVDAGPFTIRVHNGLRALASADTVIAPGLADPFAPVPPAVLTGLRRAAARGARVASICVGAFTLAASGLLDGRRATTHWAAAAELARRYPAVTVDPDVLYVDEGQVLTSAGAAAGLDLCLHLIRRDYGSAIAADTARACVMPLERDGGQAQFIVHPPPTADRSSLSGLLQWLAENSDPELSLSDIAAQANTSARTLNRRFREQTGTTPLRWLLRARIRRAQYLLETTDHAVERIAHLVGFGSPTAFRERFKEIVAVSPQAYRHTFHRSP